MAPVETESAAKATDKAVDKTTDVQVIWVVEPRQFRLPVLEKSDGGLLVP
jgi:hypothetical protein